MFPKVLSSQQTWLGFCAVTQMCHCYRSVQCWQTFESFVLYSEMALLGSFCSVSLGGRIYNNQPVHYNSQTLPSPLETVLKLWMKHDTKDRLKSTGLLVKKFSFIRRNSVAHQWVERMIQYCKWKQERKKLSTPQIHSPNTESKMGFLYNSWREELNGSSTGISVKYILFICLVKEQIIKTP